MAIFNPGKCYLISVDEKSDTYLISDFYLTNIKQEFSNYVLGSFDMMPKITVEGELIGKQQLLVPKQPIDFKNISYEELINIIKE